MIKQLFKTKEEYIKTIYGGEDTGDFIIGDPTDYYVKLDRENFSTDFGVYFLGKHEITNDINDDGEWAGVEYYKELEQFPNEFPCILVLESFEFEGHKSNSIEFVYIKDFKIV